MGQINLNFQSKNIDHKDHILSVFIEADSFVFGVFDKEHHLVASGHYPINENIDSPLAELDDDALLRGNYHKAIIAYSSREFVHLNRQDFEAGDFEVYFSKAATGEELLTDNFTHSEVHVVFPVKSAIRQALVKKFAPNSEIHISTAMRQHIYPSQVKRHVALVTSNKLHYMAYDKGNLNMYNAYSYRTKEDFLYFLQLASDFAKMDRESDKLEIGGWLDKTSELYNFSAPYYRHADWVKQPYMSLASDNEVHQKHHFFALYASALCVL